MNIPTTTTRTTTNAAPSALSTAVGLTGNIVGTVGATGGFGQNGWINDIRGSMTPKTTTATGTSTTTPVKKRGGLIRAKRPQKKGLGWLKEMKR
jgi:hypothetical protein